MKRPNEVLAISLLLVVAQALTGCGPAADQPSPGPTKSQLSSPSPAPTKNVASNIDVRIDPAPGPQSPSQRDTAARFAAVTNAEYRFFSHPWFIDPVYAATVLPGSGSAALDTDTIGLIGPVRIQVQSIDASKAKEATVSYCEDDRALRYLGQDGSVDIVGKAGDRYIGAVAHMTTRFVLTLEPAADGSTSATPRWLVAGGTYFANAKECRGLANLAPLPAPTRSPGGETP
jgi:hypothetical protein